MTRDFALILIVRDARRESGSRSSYNQVQRALKALGFDAREKESVLQYLDYHNDAGQPYAKFAAPALQQEN